MFELSSKSEPLTLPPAMLVDEKENGGGLVRELYAPKLLFGPQMAIVDPV